jgi:hypothetical protein
MTSRILNLRSGGHSLFLAILDERIGGEFGRIRSDLLPFPLRIKNAQLLVNRRKREHAIEVRALDNRIEGEYLVVPEFLESSERLPLLPRRSECSAQARCLANQSRCSQLR